MIAKYRNPQNAQESGAVGAAHPRIQVEHVQIDSLCPAPYNPRVISPQQMAALCESLKQFGFVDPVLVRRADKMVIGGHQRLEAARRLGWTSVPVVFLDIDEARAKALNVALNQISGDWDIPKLGVLFDTLPDDLAALTGFSDKEIQRVLREAQAAIDAMAEDAECAVPEPLEEATTQPGDLWILGEHRLLCGDSSKPADLDRLLDGVPVHLVNMDPPYNVKVEPRSNNAIAAGLSSFGATHHQALDVARHPSKATATHKRLRAKDRPLANDFVSEEEFDRLLRAWFQNASRVLLPGRSFYIWGGYANLANYPAALKEADLYFSQAVVWDKGHPVLTRKDMMGAFELAFYGWKLGAAHVFYGPNNATDLWHVQKIAPQRMCHLTEKPAELAERAIDYSSKRGEHVLDLFGGSGSTMAGALRIERRAYLMELDPLYCDVIVARYEKLTGKKAERTPA